MMDPTVDTLARTAWGEARSCGYNGLWAVVSVVLNRAHHPRWWGRTVIECCLEPWQFSCWNQADPNRAKLLAVTIDDRWFNVAISLAILATQGALTDLTNGADSYYALSMKQPPSWDARGIQTYHDTCHRFLRLELPAPSGLPEAANISCSNADMLNNTELKTLGTS